MLVLLSINFILLDDNFLFYFRIEQKYCGIEDFGSKRRLEHSFEANQSFPLLSNKSSPKRINYDFDLITTPLRKQLIGMDKIRGKIDFIFYFSFSFSFWILYFFCIMSHM